MQKFLIHPKDYRRYRISIYMGDWQNNTLRLAFIELKQSKGYVFVGIGRDGLHFKRPIARD